MVIQKNEIFVGSRISKFLRPAQRYDDFKLIRITCQAACHGKTEHGKPNRAKPVSPSRKNRAKLLLPEACSLNGTDNRQQRQRRTKRPPPEPSNILKRFHALYDNKLRYYKKKVSKLYCLLNPLPPTVRIYEHLILAQNC